MKAPAFARLLLLFCTLFALTGATSAQAEDLFVEHNPAGGNFGTIQEAINEAERRLAVGGAENSSFRIIVRASPDSYHGPVRPISNVPIIGESTSGTFIEGGAQTLIVVRDVANVTIRNFTFRNAALAISVADSADMEITNNVFDMGRGAGQTAILLQDARNTAIRNNTFFNNDTAISTTSAVTVTNNIFAYNQTAISAAAPLIPTYNLFFKNVTPGVEPDETSIPNRRVADADPRFVDAEEEDFHLRDDSPAKGSGNPSYMNSFDNSFDMGAYGGPEADIPLQGVTGLSATFASPGTVRLAWTPSGNTAVTAYRVYYGRAAGSFRGEEASEGVSPITISGRTTAGATLSGFTATPQPPAAPSLSVTSQNEALRLDWTSVPGASGYRIYYSTTAFTADTLPDDTASTISINDPGRTFHTIPGLVNGTPYYVAMQAVADNTLFVAVTSVVDPALAPSPGSANESGYSQTSVTLGEAVEVAGALSEVISESPAPVIPYPNLSGEGCFIATAAFGFYSAPQVQLLRDFRDRYLMPHAVGRAFVSWYYRNGPAAAAFIDSHPWLKPPVRLALFPLVALSFFLVKIPWTVRLLLATLAGGYLLVSRRKRSRQERADTAGRASEGGAA